MQATDNSKRRQEPFGMVALGLTLVVMVLPLEADALSVLHRSGRFALEMFCGGCAFL
jgi:hypothetical protein